MIDPFQTFDPEADDNKTPMMEDAPRAAPPPPSSKPKDEPKIERIGRYRLDKILGEGGFGTVYLAYDEQLNRGVAVKVPRRKRMRPEDAESYLAEARVLASLDHPNIVPVYDIGTTSEGLSFVVSKVIEGSDLAKLIASSRPTQMQAAELTATIATALHYAHGKGLVHRDIKPANILLDSHGVCYVADFGLALKEEDFGKGLTFAGTPAYMSPEQARREGHRVDGRSDIFSLGIIFYEMLVGRRPFKGNDLKELLDAVANADARPPRQINDTIAKELERICLKALAKRVSERYTTAKDMADDLRHFLSQASLQQLPFAAGPEVMAALPQSMASNATGMPIGASTQGVAALRRSHNQPLEIVPHGLRSFDADDSETFLDLLPGARDRRGLPESVGFWKTRIEERDPDCTFAVGLIYGPSGCGKSSLVKAGLLPRLDHDIVAIYVEATGRDTETRIVTGLRKRLADVPSDANLKETLTALRQDPGLAGDKKVVIVIDQFEQWLHANRDRENSELAQALRQCNGSRLQCLLMVRDDFWMSVTRFLGELEVELVQGSNFAAVDLFDLRHAENVLAAFGRAFHAFPIHAAEETVEQNEFLKQAVESLAQDGKVICVRLALFAEMMKARPWTPASLRQVGGTSGLGVTFLEETFAASSANPRHRMHQKAARAVLGSLLPDVGSNIKGHMRSRDELQRASGYSRGKEFDDLLRILDGETRLITPTDPGGEDDSTASVDKGQYYQLTHDYLVPPLREWLTSKQRETRRGRAELLLAELTGVWSLRPEHRRLPSLPQWLRIRTLTRPSAWTSTQQTMMAKARRYHALRSGVAVVLVAAALWTALTLRDRADEVRQLTQASGLVERLLDAETTQAPAIIAEIAPLRRLTDPLLKSARSSAMPGSRPALHTSLALLPVDASQKEYLLERLLDAAPHEVAVLREALALHQSEIAERLWIAAEQPEPASQRLRAASALAKYDPGNSRWDKLAAPLAGQLMAENPVFLGVWLEALRPVRGKLIGPLAAAARDEDRGAGDRMLATNILADFASDQPAILTAVLLDADASQFATLLPVVKTQAGAVTPALHAELAIQGLQPREVFTKNGTIAANDAVVKLSTGESRPATSYDLPLQGGHSYRIAMTARDSKTLDAYVLVTDQADQQLAFDDDSGGRKNALLVFNPKSDGTYKMFAAAYEGAGPFTFLVTEIDGEDAKERRARRQANAALALLALDRLDVLWPLLKASPDPRVRSELVTRLAAFGLPMNGVVKRLNEEGDVSIQRAILLTLGAAGEQAVPTAERAAVIAKAQATYENASDAGLHAAAEWLLRQWGQSAWVKKVDAGSAEERAKREQRMASAKASKTPEWYLTGQRQTMVVIPGPVTFQMGTPASESKRQDGEFPHKKRIDRTFAVSTSPVTIGEFRRFDKGYQCNEKVAPAAECPVIQTNWYQAAAYCNWLSEQDGIPKDQWCFEEDKNKSKDNAKLNAVVNLKLKPNYLRLTGYRLPTEAELEYAIRGGATTSRCYGETDRLLGQFAWHAGNSAERTWPVRGKMPNDFGLFDAHGNVWCWCLENQRPYPQGLSVNDLGFADREYLAAIDPEKARTLRGGSYDDQPSYLRSGCRNASLPSMRSTTYGFRIARTIAAE